MYADWCNAINHQRKIILPLPHAFVRHKLHNYNTLYIVTDDISITKWIKRDERTGKKAPKTENRKRTIAPEVV